MPFQKVLTEEQERKLVVDYEDGFKIVELVARYGASARTVHRTLAEAEVPMMYNKRRKRKKPKRSKRLLKPCGTNAAYARHNRNGEYPCSPCLEAHAKDQENWRN